MHRDPQGETCVTHGSLRADRKPGRVAHVGPTSVLPVAIPLGSRVKPITSARIWITAAGNIVVANPELLAA